MSGIDSVGELALEAARQLRETAEHTRQMLRASHDLVRRSREQARRFEAPRRTTPPPADDPGPSKLLVDALIRAYEHAQDDADDCTRALLGQVITHVGHRIAGTVGPTAAGIKMH